MQDERNSGTAGGASTGGTGSGLGSTGSGLSGSTGGGSGSGSTGGAAGTAGGTGTLAGGGNRVGGLEELQERADHLMGQAAEQLENVAEKVDSVAGLIPKKGVGQRANSAGHTAADTLESIARFLRDNDVNSLQRELGGLVATRPLSMLLLAVGAGFVAGKALR
ncbi:MAG: hypothetical protein KY467_01735 [Gemmatimonadetes bacterium]|nr:hypothetical protein [Gemmatimonadota bacterium]